MSQKLLQRPLACVAQPRCAPRRHPLSVAIVLTLPFAVHAQSQSPGAAVGSNASALDTVTVTSSADASAEGLSKPFAGGQVSRGGRVGLFGNQDVMDTPFNTTSYTNELIQNQQSRSVGDVLLNDPSVRVARGFGNFQETYFVRGFLLSSDSVAYNGLYGLLPRQYISAELFERVELVRGATAFLNGASPGGDAIGGSLNLLPKRAPNEALNRLTAGFTGGSQAYLAADVARRFGPNASTGVRLNVARRDGGTGVHNEKVALTSASIGVDWRSANARLSADLAHQDHQLSRTRTNVTMGAAATAVPTAPSARSNWAQPWSFSNERDTYGTLRGEYDINKQVTVYGAYGHRQGHERNSLANLTVVNASTGAGTTNRFDNTADEKVDTGELGLRAKLRTGSVGHSLVASYSLFKLERRNAFGTSPTAGLATNLFTPTYYARPAMTIMRNDLDHPALNRTTKMSSFALGDTMSFLDDSLLVTVGLRHQRLEYDTYAYDTGRLDSRYEASRNSPLAAVVYKLDKDVSVYANYVESLSQGGSAPAAAANPGTTLAPYVSKQKEIGVKYDGGRFGATAALFTTDKPGQQYGGPGTVFRGGGEDRHQGLELNVYGEAMKGLRVLGGFTLLDTEQRATGMATSEGRRVVGVPSAQGTIGVEWDVPSVRGLSIDSRLLATRGSYTNGANTIKAPGWGRLDLGARYLVDVGGKLVSVRARVDNVFNRDYWASVGGFPNSGYLVLGTPRVFSLSASIDL